MMSGLTPLTASPFVFVLFGATGDLAKNKLFPALFSLFKQDLLGKKFYIIVFSRREINDVAFREMVREYLHLNLPAGKAGYLNNFNEGDWEGFAKNIYYQQGMFDLEQGYLSLIDRLNMFDQEVGACITRVFYLATPPENYHPILDHLASTKLSEGCGQGSNKWTKI